MLNENQFEVNKPIEIGGSSNRALEQKISVKVSLSAGLRKHSSMIEFTLLSPISEQIEAIGFRFPLNSL